MHYRSLFSSIVLGLAFALINQPSFAQRRERPKLKDFGSSLKNMRWDPEANRVVEAREDPLTRKAEAEDTITIDTTLVAWDVLVVDKQGRPVRGLTANDFNITEDGVPQQVGHFLLGDNSSLPRSIVLIIDYSGSQFPYIRNSVDSAKILIDKLGPLDRMAIVTDDVEMLVDFTTDKAELKKKLDLLIERNKGKKGLLGFGGAGRQFGRSAQYSALMATLREAFDEEDQRPIVVFQTDGDEAFYLRNSINTPTVPPNIPLALRAQVQEQVEQQLKLQSDGMTEFSLEDVYKAVEKSRATIYTVIPGIKLVGFPSDEQIRRLKADDERRISEWLNTVRPKTKKVFMVREEERQKRMTPEIWQMRTEEAVRVQSALAAVAPLTGGWTQFLEAPYEAEEIYSRIFNDINQRYIVGYYPTNKTFDGQRRKIDVKIKGHPDYEVMGRKSYYAPVQ